VRLAADTYQELLVGLLVEGRAVVTRVRGVSMGKAVPDGATVRIEPLGDRRVRAGEVVLTRTPRGLICHRVLSTRPGQALQTWGDVCPTPDEPVASGDALGRVVALEVDGNWQASAPRPWWWMRGRHCKGYLRKLLGMVDGLDAGACTTVPEQDNSRPPG